MTIPDATWEFRVGASRSASSAVDNLPWHGFGKIRGDERGINERTYKIREEEVSRADSAWAQPRMREVRRTDSESVANDFGGSARAVHCHLSQDEDLRQARCLAI